MTSNPSFAIHRIDPGAPESVVQQILDLNADIHNAKSKNLDHHLTVTGWMDHLNQPRSYILYATNAGSAEPIGFLFCHMKHRPEYENPTLHLWIAGVIENERRKGVFRTLMIEAEKHARELGIEAIGMATYPARFPRMVDILSKVEGFKLKGWEAEGSKLRFIKPL